MGSAPAYGNQWKMLATSPKDLMVRLLRGAGIIDRNGVIGAGDYRLDCGSTPVSVLLPDGDIARLRAGGLAIANFSLGSGTFGPLEAPLPLRDGSIAPAGSWLIYRGRQIYSVRPKVLDLADLQETSQGPPRGPDFPLLPPWSLPKRP